MDTGDRKEQVTDQPPEQCLQMPEDFACSSVMLILILNERLQFMMTSNLVRWVGLEA